MPLTSHTEKSNDTIIGLGYINLLVERSSSASDNMEQKNIIKQTANYVKDFHKDESSGHDWFHIHRVWNNAIAIQKAEGGDLFTIELTALLHDLDDYKITTDDQNKTARWLQSLDINITTRQHILNIIESLSFKGAGLDDTMTSIEGKIVQDADRLDAIGAVGIARTFAYGGSKGRLMYDPDIIPEMHQSFEAYKNSDGPTINHFYEKLLLLKEKMKTTTGKEMAEERHVYMENFLRQFYKEASIKS